MTTYTKDFHKNLHQKTESAADLIAGMVLDLFPHIRSAIDVGCGLGTWLRAFAKRGVEHIVGLDGSWVDRPKLLIPESSFVETDLNAPLRWPGRYDLAVCLEVAEHLLEQQADPLVDFLASKSDVVLFSAAIPRQGGPFHVNEQWPSYWVAKFSRHGMLVLDVLRQAIWEQVNVPYWYRQNLLLVVGAEAMKKRKRAGWEQPSLPLDLVHPYLFMEVTEPPTLRAAVKQLGGAMRRSVRRRFCRGSRAGGASAG